MNNYKSQHERIYFQSTTGLRHNIELNLRKVHKAQKAIFFIEKCLEHTVQPKFVQLPKGLKQHLNKDKVYKVQQSNLKAELKNQKNILPILKNTVNTLLYDLKKTTKNNFEYESFLKTTNNIIYNSETKNDEKRDRKLRFLINEKLL